MSNRVFFSLLALAVVVAVVLRVASPNARPMHHDEANQAVKFGELLETGDYHYDWRDHHGPTLYYLTLPVAWLRGQHTLAALDEQTLRMVPAVFGIGLVLLFPLLAGGLGRTAVATSMLLAAISPALTYYSRFYIQEPLVAFFALGFLIALGRYATQPSLTSAVWAGACAGLAYATKETSVIVFASAGAACVLARLLERRTGVLEHRTEVLFHEGRRTYATHALTAVLVALAVAFLFYSSFLRNPAGPLDSIRAYSGYLHRGIDAGGHAEPWYYYLRMLAWTRSGGLMWTEALILVLASVGIVAASRPRRPASGGADAQPAAGDAGASARFWPRYLALYSLVAALLFSLVPYKTPWNLLPFYVGFVLMAGVGFAEVASIRARALRAIAVVVVLFAAVQLAGQSWRASFRYGADPRNPYAYVQTSPDFLRLVARINDLASLDANGSRMLVEVIAGPYEQWPLPWYLRGMKRVGYWSSVRAAGALDGVPVIVAAEDQAAPVEAALGDRYVSEFYGLRPGVLMALFIERPVWDRFLRSREPTSRPR